MKVYLLTAAGVIFLSVIVSLIIPEGKLHKSVTFVMRLICIFVLIQPVTALFNIKVPDATASGDYFDYEYVSGVYTDHQSEQLEILIENEFKTDVDCLVKVDYEEEKFKVTEVRVGVDKKDEKLFEDIYAYLDGLGYINITVYAKSS